MIVSGPVTRRDSHHEVEEIKPARVTDLRKSVDQLQEFELVNMSSAYLSLAWRRLPSCGDNDTPPFAG